MVLRDQIIGFANNLKLRYKLIFAYMVIAFIPIVIVGQVSYSLSVNFMIRQVVSSLEKELMQVAEDINYKLDLCRKESDLILFDRQINKILVTNYEGELQKLNEAYIDVINPKFEILRMMQTDVKVYTINETLFPGNKNIYSINEIKDNPMYEKLLSGETSMLWQPVFTLAKSRHLNYPLYLIGQDEIHTAGSDNIVYEKVLTLSRVIDNANKNIIGILDVYLPLKTIEKALGNINVPDNGSVVYYDSNGNIITAFNTPDLDEHVLNGILNDDRQSGSINANDRIMLFRKTAVNKATLIVSYPMSYITGTIGIIKDTTLWTIIISIISVVLISFLIAGLITRRLNRLMAKINHIRDTGISDVTVTIPGNDEIANIDKMFNVMISRINELQEKQIRSEVAKKVMEMEILREQINPHFLYNSLSSIKWSLRNTQRQDLENVIDSLVRFYRLGLNKGREIISIRDEMQINREYINIQKFTYDAAYEVIWDISEEALDYYCIKLILQPFIENAVIHGLNQKKEGGLLKIGVYLEYGKIYFVIEDNGRGFDTGILAEDAFNSETTGYKGFGIKNAIRRIKLTYGDRSSIDIKSAPEKGTRVTVEIPALSMNELDDYIKAVFSY